MSKSLHLPRYKTQWRQICAILPAYLPDGTNGTAITYLDGAVEEISHRLCWVLDDLLGYLRSSTAILTKQSRSILGRKARRVPLVLKKDFCLVPVKGREKLGRYDAVTGYVVLRHVEKLASGESGSRILFTGGVRLQVRDNPRVLQDKISQAGTLQEQIDAS